MKKIRIIKSRPIKEEEEVIDQVPQDTAPETLKITYETNPLEFILQKYPTLTETLVKLLTDDFRNYIIGVYIMAPKPTIFKIVLHNNRSFYLTYMGKCYEAKVSGKKFWLLKVSELETATIEIANLLMLGTPPSVKGPETEMAAAPEEAPAEEAPAEETPPSEEAPEELAEGIKLTKETPEDIQQDLKPLGYESDNFKKISGKKLKLVVPRKERDTTVTKIVTQLSDKGYKKDKDPDNKYQINTPDGTSLIVKPEEAQGQASVRIELEALTGLLKQLKQLGSANIKIGGKIYKNISGGRKVEGTPKADLALTNTDGEDVIFISHKDGDSAKDFQQYGGVSAVSDHPEVQSFAQAVRDNKEVKKNGGVMVRGGGFKRKVKDKKLILQSMYGLNYGGPFSKNNVQIICQGPLRLEKSSGNTYELKSNHDMLNGQLPVGGYVAYFMATFRSDRKDMGIKYCRIGIYPVETRPTAQDI